MADDFHVPNGSDREENPEDLLGDVWTALDVLPTARSTPSLASSTIEMAAVSIARDAPLPARSGNKSAADRSRWTVAGVIVAACLAAGFVAGSAGPGVLRSPRGPELMAVVKHLGVLEEAGSVGFLEAFAEGDYTPPVFLSRESLRRGRPESGADNGDRATLTDQGETSGRPAVATPELDDALADFQLVFLEGQSVLPFSPPSDLPGSEGESGSKAERVEEAHQAAVDFEVNRLAFYELPPSQREAFVSLAESLADPQRSDLVEAARLWHAWVTFADPVERAGLVELPTSERLEWLDRRMRQWRRFMPGRPGDGERSDETPGIRSGGSRGPGGPPRRGPDTPSRFGGDLFRRPGGSRDTGDEG